MKRHFLYFLGIAALLTSCAPKQETERLICAEAEMSVFPYSGNGLRVTKHQTITPVEGVEGLEVIETFFVNEGKSITVQAYDLCRTTITPEDTAFGLGTARDGRILPA